MTLKLLEPSGPVQACNGIALHSAFKPCTFVVVDYLDVIRIITILIKKGKGPPQEAEVALGAPVSLTLRIFLTFSTTRVVGRQL